LDGDAFLIFSGNSAQIAANVGAIQLELSWMQQHAAMLLREAGASLASLLYSSTAS
jgi:hypothetical protein